MGQKVPWKGAVWMRDPGQRRCCRLAWSGPSGLLCASLSTSFVLPPGSKGTSKEGGGSAGSRGGSTPLALGDLFAGGFPVLRPAGQRDAAGKEGSRMCLPLTCVQSPLGNIHLPRSEPSPSRASSIRELNHRKSPRRRVALMESSKASSHCNH